MADPRDELVAALELLLGQTVWGAEHSAYGMLTIDMGAVVPYPTGGGRSELSLYVLDAAWRLHREGIMWCGTRDRDDTGKQLEHLEGTTIESAAVLNDRIDLQLGFSDGSEIDVFVCSTRDVDAWSLFVPGRSFVVRGADPTVRVGDGK